LALGSAGINIASYHQARRAPQPGGTPGDPLAVINVDQASTNGVLDKLQTLTGCGGRAAGEFRRLEADPFARIHQRLTKDSLVLFFALNDHSSVFESGESF